VAHVDPLERKNTRPRSRSWSPPSFTPNGRPSSRSPRAPTCAGPTGAASSSGEVVLRHRLSRFTIVIAPGGAAVASEALYKSDFLNECVTQSDLWGEKGGPSQGINPPKVRWVGQMPRATGRKLVAGYAVYAIQINKSCDAVRRNLFVVITKVLLLGQAC
jgi:hypothetical protein